MYLEYRTIWGHSIVSSPITLFFLFLSLFGLFFLLLLLLLSLFQISLSVIDLYLHRIFLSSLSLFLDNFSRKTIYTYNFSMFFRKDVKLDFGRVFFPSRRSCDAD